jgi:mannose-1-phosphate guanylyltransferase
VPTANIIVQPRNCGTANGILLPLLHILDRDPEARILILPSDHHVRDERVLAAALQCAMQELSTRADQVLLMGILPEEADPDLGYIVPGSRDGAALLQMFIQRFPYVVNGTRQVVMQNQFTPGLSAAALDLYRDLPDIDFSRQILQGAEPMLRVMQVPRCGWSDLGTPKRLAETLRTLPRSSDLPTETSNRLDAFLHLALQQARMPPAVVQSGNLYA